MSRQKEELDKSHRHIQRIYASVNWMAHLMQDLMIIEKFESGKIQVQRNVFNMNHFMEHLLNKMAADTKDNQNVQFQHSGMVNVAVDNRLLRGIVVNYYFICGK